MPTPTSQDPSFVVAMIAALAEHAPLTPVELAERIGADEDAVAKELSYRGDVLETEQGRYAVSTLAQGAVLTHVVTAEELTLDVLSADGDLDLWGRLADTGTPYADGGAVHSRYGGQSPYRRAVLSVWPVRPGGWTGCSSCSTSTSYRNPTQRA